MLRITASQVAAATTCGLWLCLCFARVHACLIPGAALLGGPAACQAGRRGVLEAPPPTSPDPTTKLWDLSRTPLGSFSAAPLRHGVCDQAIRALHVLLLRVGGRQEDPDQACDSHRRRPDGRGHRAGERAARPGCAGTISKRSKRAPRAPLFHIWSLWPEHVSEPASPSQGRLREEHWFTPARRSWTVHTSACRCVQSWRVRLLTTES